MEIARVFLNQDMRQSFQGLREQLRSARINPDTMSDKMFVVFINRAATKFKLLAGPHYLVYYNNGGRRFPLEALQNLPQCFDGKKFDFNRAIEKTLTDRLAAKGQTTKLVKKSTTKEASAH